MTRTSTILAALWIVGAFPLSARGNDLFTAAASGEIRTVEIVIDRDGRDRLERFPFVYAPCSVVYGDRRLDGAGVRHKGNSTFSLSRDHRSFKVSLGYFGGADDLLGHSTLNLHHPFKDPSRVREVLAYRVFRDAGVRSPRAAHVRLTLTVSGTKTDLGVYTLTEQVGKGFLKRAFETKSESLFKIEGAGDPFGRSDRPRRGVRGSAYDGFISKVGKARGPELSRLLEAVAEPDLDAVERLLDVDAFIAWLAVNCVLVNLDSYAGVGHNGYIRGDANGRFTLIPWDANEAFGKFTFGQTASALETSNVFRPFVGPKALIECVLSRREWRQQYSDKLRKVTTDGPCSSKRLLEDLGELHARIAEAVAAERNPEHAVALFFSAGDPRGDGLAGFITRRLESVRSQLSAPAVATFVEDGPPPDDLAGGRLRGFGPGPPGFGGPPRGVRRPRRAPWWAVDAVTVAGDDLFVASDGTLRRLDRETREEKARLGLRDVAISGRPAREPGGGDRPRARDDRGREDARTPNRPRTEREPSERPRGVDRPPTLSMTVDGGTLYLVSRGVLLTVELTADGFGKPTAKPLDAR